MKALVRLEEAALFGFGIYLFATMGYAWWWFAALLLAPDVSMAGYAFGNKAGAWLYNAAHHKGIAIVIYLGGSYLEMDTLQLAGVMLFAHSSMDRLLGYGLKYEKGFRFTHLGEIGNHK